MNVVDRLALLTTGEVVPIAKLFDEDGDETDDVEACVAFICGRDGLGWFTCLAEDFEWGGKLN